jgi:hypothetical protein
MLVVGVRIAGNDAVKVKLDPGENQSWESSR